MFSCCNNNQNISEVHQKIKVVLISNFDIFYKILTLYFYSMLQLAKTPYFESCDKNLKNSA